MDLMWAQGQYNMPLKCIGISEEHVNDADCSGDFSMHFWCPFLWTRVCVCVSLHVTNDNGMYSIRRGHFIQNVTPIPSTHGEARALENAHCPQKSGFMIWSKDELRSVISIAWYRASHSLQETDTPNPPSLLALKWQEDPFGSGGSGRTAASDSRGHRDRQQTRQLRKDLTLLFSIINEQQSKQIRTEGGWGLPVCCSGAERSALGLTAKFYTPTDLLKCDFA